MKNEYNWARLLAYVSRSLCRIRRHSKIHLVSVYCAGISDSVEHLRFFSVHRHLNGRVGYGQRTRRERLPGIEAWARWPKTGGEQRQDFARCGRLEALTSEKSFEWVTAGPLGVATISGRDLIEPALMTPGLPEIRMPTIRPRTVAPAENLLFPKSNFVNVF